MARRLAGLLENLVEATATPYPVDRYLEFVNPMLTWRETRAKVLRRELQTDRTVTLTLTPTRQWKGHTAGQYIEVSAVVDGVRHRRFFSPANAENGDGTIELTVTAHDDGFISKHLRSQLQVGDVVGLSAAAGEFVLPAQRPEHTVLVSGGSGITPVISMLRTLVAEGHTKPVTLVHYARDPQDVPYAAELTALANSVDNVDVRFRYTRGADGEHFTPAHLDGLADADGAQVFLCGPASLMAAVKDDMADRGLSDRLHSEAFTVDTSPVIDPNQPITGTVTYTESDLSSSNDGRTILEQAEAAGLSPEYGCRMGICFSCTSVRRSGCTRNILTGELDSEADQPIQICVNAPVGDVDIEL
ncbi:putative NADPH oxidoreductase [Gordonia hirsuta DSM 44140 = NBRC 16056]|uniref:Putative NADPH oxidoreductase n=1 Tax=Gordonia hirsuta DSM 44140 = NBRC 16056 TaxID=1121927 RepID=L7LBR5_9ACTN|nr:ferredoxin reductase [Gordonia hirsuta]GAC58374.1 putative NADPH oxidoreductase [Gordonia hirsuta DSM 44140 = NBRC 16056]